MKNLITILIILTFTSCGMQGQRPLVSSKDSLLSPSLLENPHTADGVDSKALSKLPTMIFPDSVYNFGKINEGENVAYDFSFTNTGNGPLIIGNVETTCGCTATDYPHNPIPHGEGGSIHVIFRSAGKDGHQEKEITVSTNTDRNTYHLKIVGDVIPKE